MNKNERISQIIKLKLGETKKSSQFTNQEMEAYPWDECMADQIARYGDEETAAKVCGAIKAGMKKTFAEGDSLEGACWPGYEAVGLKDLDGRLVPNCVPIKEEQSKVVKEGFPIPSPESGEEQDKYISRCMESIGNEYDTQEQALAVCYAQLEK
jgi:hypothetical protein